MLYREKIEDRSLTFRKLANDLRKELLKGTTIPPKAGRVVAKGAFGPSFAELDNSEQTQKQGDSKDERGKGKSKGKRRMTTGESSAECPACGLLGHTLPNCLYVFPEKAKGKFRP